MIFAVADTETTGLPNHRASSLSAQPRIIEIAVLLTDGKDVLETFECIVNPCVAIETIITEITGLTNEDLADKPFFKDVIPQVGAVMDKADAIVFHNASFDRSMFEFDLRRLDLGLEAINWPDLTICTVEETMPRFGRRMKLQELYAKYCGEYTQKHRALDDVRLLHEVCKAIGLYDAYTSMWS